LLKRAPALRKGAKISSQEIGHRVARDVPREREGAVLEEVIVLIEASPVEDSAEREIALSLYPSDCVVPVESSARKNRVGESAETEVARDAEGFDRLVGSLVNILNSKIANVRNPWGGWRLVISRGTPKRKSFRSVGLKMWSTNSSPGSITTHRPAIA
jgi:hypothetical protein